MFLIELSSVISVYLQTTPPTPLCQSEMSERRTVRGGIVAKTSFEAGHRPSGDPFRGDRERGLCMGLLIRTPEVWFYKSLLYSQPFT
jgi:hypothetical protein